MSGEAKPATEITEGQPSTPTPPVPDTGGPTVSEAQVALEEAKAAFYATRQQDPQWQALRDKVDEAKAVYTDARRARRY